MEAMAPARSVEVVRHSSPLGRWESAVGPPHPALRPYVRQYFGGTEETYQPLVRRELPSEIAPLIINFGPPFRVFDPIDGSKYQQVSSFVTGAFDSFVVVGTTGAYACIQVNFTLLGMRLFLQRPLHELANKIVSLDDVFGSDGDRLVSELYEAPTWASRFDIVDREILKRVAELSAPAPSVQWAWRRMLRSAGQVAISDLAREVGWSHKHLVSRFTEEIGLTPKVMARVLRFGHAANLLETSERGQLAQIAVDCGYYDQAHFTRDFRAFAGVSPMELLASRLPNGGFTA
jgi:AraC-like DNA-binding protein